MLEYPRIRQYLAGILKIIFVFKTKNVVYVRTWLVIFFIIGGFMQPLYNIGIIGTIALLLLGILWQAFELIKRKLK